MRSANRMEKVMAEISAKITDQYGDELYAKLNSRFGDAKNEARTMTKAVLHKAILQGTNDTERACWQSHIIGLKRERIKVIEYVLKVINTNSLTIDELKYVLGETLKEYRK